MVIGSWVNGGCMPCWHLRSSRMYFTFWTSCTELPHNVITNMLDNGLETSESIHIVTEHIVPLRDGGTPARRHTNCAPYTASGWLVSAVQGRVFKSSVRLKARVHWACSTCPSKTVRLTYVNRMRLTDRKEMYNYVLAPAHACVVTYGKKIRRLRRSDRTDMFVPSVKTDAIPERNSQRMTSGFGNSQRMTSGFGISH